MALEVTTIDITYKRGDSRAIIFTLTDSETNGPLDLTGYTAPVLAVNSDATPSDITNEQFKVTGVIDVDPLTGRIAFSPTSVQTDINPDVYFYDAQVVDAASGILTFVQGQFVIAQDIAKD